MTLEKCKNCETSLVSSSEIRTKLCLECAEYYINDYFIIKTKFDELKSEHDCLKLRLEYFEKLKEAKRKIEEALSRGKEAYKRNCKLEENPYEKSTNEYIFWSDGWFEEEKLNLIQKYKAIMIETVNIIDHVQNLSLGYGNEEISNKLEKIHENLIPLIFEK